MVENSLCPAASLFKELSDVCDLKLAGKCDETMVSDALRDFVYDAAKPIWDNDPMAAFFQNSPYHGAIPQQ